MNDYFDDEPIAPAPDREFTLSPAAITAIFIVLVIVCAACFGLGYTMGGRKSASPIVAEAPAIAPSSASTTLKPSAGSAIGSSNTITPKPAAATAPSPAQTPSTAPVAHAAPADTPHPTTPAAPTPIITGNYVVQVAAVSLAHQEDAENLVHALRSHGYSVNAFPEPDKLIHIQAGPFTSRAAAEAMRARLAVDGYQPLIKQQ